MDPATTKTLQGQTVQTIGDTYFGSIAENTKLHLVESRTASLEEIQTDFRTWYGGFLACAKLLGGDPNMLPHLEAVLPQITKQFPDRAKNLAA